MKLAEELGNVSRACQVMGFSRDSFYRYKELAEQGGLDALVERSRRNPNLKNRIASGVEHAELQMSLEQPAYGQVRLSNELNKQGILISASGVRCVWLRHGLECFKKRLAALEAKVAQEGLILTEAQLQALDKKRQEQEACGEIETECPRVLGSQDTFYVGTMKGLGRIYQQSFVDTYSKVAQAKLYLDKTPLSAADLLNDKVLPLFEAHGIEAATLSSMPISSS